MGEVRCRATVGRSDEIGLLAEVVAAAHRGEGSLTFVLGEAGAGKTRLVSEALERAREAGMASVRGRAAATAVPAPYRPFSEVFLDGFRASGPPAVGGAGYLPAAVVSPPRRHRQRRHRSLHTYSCHVFDVTHFGTELGCCSGSPTAARVRCAVPGAMPAGRRHPGTPAVHFTGGVR